MKAFDFVKSITLAALVGATALTAAADDGVQLWKGGPCWAECNLGATKPEEYGYYFMWGDTNAYVRNTSNNGWISVNDGKTLDGGFVSGNCATYGKAPLALLSQGYIDSTGNLVAAYDASTACLGGAWRMPTTEEMKALVENCTAKWITTNGVWGCLVTGKGDYALKSIFLPAAGLGSETGRDVAGVEGYYWASTPDSTSTEANILLFGSGYINYNVIKTRETGMPVRAVQTAPEPIAFSVTAPTHVTAAVYTNAVDAANIVPAGGTVWSNKTAYVVYTTDSNYYFDGWITAITNTLNTSVDPAVDTNAVPQAGKAVQLTDVSVENATNVTVWVGRTPVTPDAEGAYTIRAGEPIDLTYTANEGYMFELGATEKTITLTLAENHAMSAEEKAPVVAVLTEVLADERTVQLDTRKRIVVSDPSEVLPIAYSTNSWGAVAGGFSAIVGIRDPQGEVIGTEMYGEDGYAEWQPEQDQFGKYMLVHGSLAEVGGNIQSPVTNYIYYAKPFPLTIEQPEGGTITVTNADAAVASGDDVLGYSLLDVVATPAENYEFASWCAATNGIESIDGFADATAATTTFEMPNTNVTICARFTVCDAYVYAATNALTVAYTNDIAYLETLLTGEELEKAKADVVEAYGKGLVEILATKGTTMSYVDAALAKACADVNYAAAKHSQLPITSSVVAGEGTVVVTNEAIVGTTVEIVAMPADKWQFDGWTGSWIDGEVTNDLIIADWTEASTSFVMTNGEVKLTASFALSEEYREGQIAAVSNDCEEALAAIGDSASLSKTEKAKFVGEYTNACATAFAALKAASTPAEVDKAVAAAKVAFGLSASDVAWTTEGRVRFGEEQSQMTVEEGQSLDVVVYGGSVSNSSAAILTLIKNTYTKTPTAYMDGKRVRFPLTLNWAKGDREPKVITLVTKATRSVEVDKFFTLQLQAPSASELGVTSIATVTVVDQNGASDDSVPYVRALAWPGNDGKVTGSGYDKSSRGRTLQARAKRWATFAGWYRASADDANKIDLSEDGFVSADRKIKVLPGDAGTYFAYFTDGTPVIAVRDPDWDADEVIGVEASEEGIGLCKVGCSVSFPLDFVTAEGDNTGRLAVSKLPKGLKYNRKTGLVTGVPTRAGVYTAKVIGKNISGKHTITFTMVVEALPAGVVGTFTGSLLDSTGSSVGTVTLKVNKSGSINVRVTYARKNYSFSTKGFLPDDENDAVLTKKNVGTVTLLALTDAEEEPTGEWTGTVSGAKFGEEPLTFSLVK